MGGKVSAQIDEAADSNAVELNLDSSKLSSLPKEVFARLRALETLSVRDNNIKNVPEEVFKLEHLTDLDLTQNALSALPDSLARCTALRELKLLFNKFAVMPACIPEMRHLAVLNLHANKLSAIPPSIANLSRCLEKLVVQDNSLAALPEELGECVLLKWLWAGNNAIVEVPEEICHLPLLRLLSLPSNQIEVLPDDFVLTSLVRLNVAENKLRRLPASLGNCKSLEEIVANDNRLESLPESLRELEALRVLNVANNAIAELSPTLGHVVTLETLEATNNQIVVIPSAFGSLTNLATLHLASNKIAYVPTSLALLSNLDDLTLNNNPIKMKKLRRMTKGKRGVNAASTREYLQVVRMSTEQPAAERIQHAIRAYTTRKQFRRVFHMVLAVHQQQELLSKYHEDIRDRSAALSIAHFWKSCKARRNWAFLADKARELRGTYEIHDYFLSEDFLSRKDDDMTFRKADAPSNIRYLVHSRAVGGEFESSVDDRAAADIDREFRDLPQVTAGTIGKLVEKLTSGYVFKDDRYADVFLLTFRVFMKPMMLLDALITRFGAEAADPLDALPRGLFPDASFDALLDDLTTVQDAVTADWHHLRAAKEIARPQQRAVLMVLRLWIRDHIYDFEDQILTRRLCAWLEDTHPGLETEVAQLAAFFEEQRLTGDVPEFAFAKNARDAPPSFLPPSAVAAELHLLDLHPLEVARQLALIEQSLFTRINGKEFVNQAWSKRGKEANAPNILALIDFFNHVSAWVATSVVNAEEDDERARTMEFFIDVAGHSRELRDFNAVMEIISGLHNASVSRLKNTWTRVDIAHMEAFDALSQEMTMKGNYRTYRQLLKVSDPPCVPYIGTFLTDLTFMDDGNEDEIDGLINFDKYRSTAGVVFDMGRFFGTLYSLAPLMPLQNFIVNFPVLSDGDQHKRSLVIEPRGGGDSDTTRRGSVASRFRAGVNKVRTIGRVSNAMKK